MSAKKIKILILFIPALVLSFSCFAQKGNKKNKNNTDHRVEDFNFNFQFLEANKQKALGNFEAALYCYDNALKIDKTQSAVYYEIAGILNAGQDFAGALEYAKKAVEYDKTGNEYYKLLLALVYQANNMQDNAIKAYQEIVKLYPQKMEYYFELANMYASANKIKEAIKVLDNVEKLFGVIDLVSLEKERYYLHLNDKKSALNEIKTLSNAYPQDLKYKAILAESYINSGDIESARKIYKELESSNIEDGLLYFSIADFYRMDGNYNKAFEYLAKGFSYEDVDLDFKVKLMVDLFEMVKSNKSMFEELKKLLDVLMQTYTDNLKVRALYSDYYVFTGDFKSAQKELDYILEKEKDKFQIWSQGLYVDYVLNDMKSMYKRGKEAVELYPNYLEFYKYYIISAYSTQHYEDVVNAVDYASMLAVNNQSVLLDFLSMQGDSYHELGKNHESDSVYDVALQKDEKFAIVLNNYSYYLAVRGEKLDKAMEMSTRLVSIDDRATYLDTHAWVLYKSGEFEKALEYIEKAIVKDSKNAVYFEHKGDILYKLNKLDKAMEMWLKAKELVGGSELLQEKIDKKTLVE
jgi:tetratricopeptide (TPR) repeat protein